MWILIVIMSAGPYNQYKTVSMQEFNNYDRCADAAKVVKENTDQFELHAIRCVKK